MPWNGFALLVFQVIMQTEEPLEADIISTIQEAGFATVLYKWI